MTKETYWAVRIGRPRTHMTYFALGANLKTPALFVNRSEAADFVTRNIGKGVTFKVVRVKLEERKP